ncbi:MAG: TRAP transporter small permease [Betaproteobacteria bacterium]|nr:MAG: TRAP transporter small permease [Betaproteobacteria bacterium]
MRKFLDTLYTGSGILAGVFLILIAALSLAQICGRVLGFDAYSFDDFAGFCMAASSFLGLAHTYRRNEHIRVSILVDRLAGGSRRVLEILCLSASAFLIGYFAWYATDMVLTSYQINDVSQGLVPVPLWIPQSGMALGLAIMTIAMLDDLILVLRRGTPSYQIAEQNKSLALSENI